jgi:hypothetical protein
LDPTSEPFLDHHRIDGTPVLPGVMGLEAFVEFATAWAGGRRLRCIEDVRFLAPFKFYRDEPRDLELHAQLERDGDEMLARCALTGIRMLAGRSEPQLTQHFTASVRLAGEPWPGAESRARTSEPAAGVGADDIYRVYFHGPAFQVLDSAWREDGSVVGRLRASLPELAGSGREDWAAVPRLVELCFQAAGVWEIGSTGHLGLPHRIERVWIAPDAAEDPGDRYAVVSPRDDGSCDVEVTDEAGRALVRLEGYATALLPDPLPDSVVAPLRGVGTA